MFIWIDVPHSNRIIYITCDDILNLFFFFERKRLFVGHAEVKFQFFRLSVVLTMKIFVYFDLTDFTVQNNNETKNINKSPITRFTPRYLNQSLNVFFYSPYISTHILHRRRIVRLLPSFFASPYALIRLHQELHALKKTGFFYVYTTTKTCCSIWEILFGIHIQMRSFCFYWK